ncbi:hypothetical protein [Nocardia sp. NBC_01009]|uniref:hypothetical protein n=1 Tax=Nocardia sp. NBC_01009 TaxID=2975996 RepID=UPI0038663436|nr:hypothetical protein OHA42_38595 [Nocardia sp. NBC_01009]
MAVPDPASDAASVVLYLDPETFPASVAGVATAHNCVAIARSQLINSVPGNSDVFGDEGVQSTCSSFHDAWQGETDVAASALAEAAWLLATAVQNLVGADIQGGATVTSAYPPDSKLVVSPQNLMPQGTLPPPQLPQDIPVQTSPPAEGADPPPETSVDVPLPGNNEYESLQ